jgi:hypothetical protein
MLEMLARQRFGPPQHHQSASMEQSVSKPSPIGKPINRDALNIPVNIMVYFPRPFFVDKLHTVTGRAVSFFNYSIKATGNQFLWRKTLERYPAIVSAHFFSHHSFHAPGQ